MGYTRIIEASGAKFATDTCCVVAPIKGRFRALATDSAKACYYAYAKNKFKTVLKPFDEVVGGGAAGDYTLARRTICDVAARSRRGALVTRMGISFFGGVDPETGVVVERGHELEGQSIAARCWSSPPAKARPSARTRCTG